MVNSMLPMTSAQREHSKLYDPCGNRNAIRNKAFPNWKYKWCRRCHDTQCSIDQSPGPFGNLNVPFSKRLYMWSAKSLADDMLVLLTVPAAAAVTPSPATAIDAAASPISSAIALCDCNAKFNKFCLITLDFCCCCCILFYVIYFLALVAFHSIIRVPYRQPIEWYRYSYVTSLIWWQNTRRRMQCNVVVCYIFSSVFAVFRSVHTSAHASTSARRTSNCTYISIWILWNEMMTMTHTHMHAQLNWRNHPRTHGLMMDALIHLISIRCIPDGLFSFSSLIFFFYFNWKSTKRARASKRDILIVFGRKREGEIDTNNTHYVTLLSLTLFIKWFRWLWCWWCYWRQCCHVLQPAADPP